MELTKYAHACVALAKGGRTIVIDPGVFTPDAREAVAGADAVLITHEHFDHVDEEMLGAALRERAGLRVWAPPGVRQTLGDRGGRVTAVTPGERLEIAGFEILAVGGTHARIHQDIPQVENVGFVIDGALYHPGDAYFVPDVPVQTLLLPTSGPWTKFGEAADFVRAVRPARVVQIHEVMLSEIGQASVARILGKDGLTGLPIEQPAPGTTLDL
ncbi:MBL fold metallo-hydrolase [Actinoplanes subtropicus]|uniref:MBL fold metallo-hydrolase n=1 Tax=Actinoplanes subtropicus TaxID=543632 RepID=UPI0004C2D60C|nr:MBL fold metallo-hydrolase [Actinoplanes subtropicus]